MASRAYTFRIAYCEQVDAQVVYEVPAKKRVVVRNVLARSDATAQGWCAVGVHGIQVLFHQFQAPYESYNLETRLVAYERETIKLTTGFQPIYAMVTGYIFDDPDGAPPTTKPGSRDRQERPAIEPY